MDARLLKYFVILSEEMNYRKAAERLFITQPTLSQQIKQLEQDAGVPLVERVGNQIQLTEEGKLLKVEAYRILKELSALDQKLKNYHESLTHGIRIGVSGINLIIRPIELFAAAYPEIQLQVYEHSFDTLYTGIMNGEFAFGLSYNSDIPNDHLSREIMGYDEFQCVLPLKHELIEHEYVSSADLVRYPLILAQEKLSARKFLSHYENLNGIKLLPRYEMPNYTSCLDLVKKGLGISVLPKSFLNNYEEEDFQIIELGDFDQQREISLLYKRERAFSTYEEELLNYIREVFKKD